MKRAFLAFALVALGLAAVPLVANAGHSNGPSQGTGPKFEKANGTGESATYGRVHVNADDNGRGQDLGHFFIGPPSGPVAVQGDVTCLRVDGDNVATVGGRERVTNAPFIIEITDNGSPGAGADRHRWRPASPNEVGPNCPTTEDFPNPSAQIQQGNYIVHG